MEGHGGGATLLSNQMCLVRQLVLFPLPFQGHINPMLQLATILHAKGFRITVIHTEFNSPNSSNYPHFTFKSIPNGSMELIKELSSDISDVPSLISLLNKVCAESFRECLAGLLTEKNEEPIAYLITDAAWHFTQSVADGLKVPRLVLRTSSLAVNLVYLAFPVLYERGYFDFSKPDSRSEAPIQELAPIKRKDISKIITGNLESMCNLIAAMIKEMKAAKGIIWNTFIELEQPSLPTIIQEFPAPNFLIGPFHKYFPASSSSLLDHDRSFFSWLDLQPASSVIYVSFGSVVQMTETEFIEMAWGLANSKQPFLWVIRPGLVYGSEWLEPLPNGFTEEVSQRGQIIKWAPQQEVLAHPAIGGFWTHNGWNSTLESICEGIPMICSPCSFDQPVISRYVNDVWKVGSLLENGMKREEIETTIKRVMVDEGKEIRQRAKSLKEKVNLSMEEGGSSYNSLQSLVNYILSF